MDVRVAELDTSALLGSASEAKSAFAGVVSMALPSAFRRFDFPLSTASLSPDLVAVDARPVECVAAAELLTAAAIDWLARCGPHSTLS